MATVDVTNVPPTIIFKGRRYHFYRYFGETKDRPVYQWHEFQVMFNRLTGEPLCDTEEDTKYG